MKMKEFLFGVFVWFLLQVVFLNAVGEMNSLKNYNGDFNCDAKDFPIAIAFIGGAIFPITLFDFVKVQSCWLD